MKKYLCYSFLFIPLVCSIFKIELWPFTYYPMFSWDAKFKDLNVYSIALQRKDESIEKWPPFLGAHLAVKKVFTYRMNSAFRSNKKEWIDEYMRNFYKSFNLHQLKNKYTHVLILKEHYIGTGSKKDSIKSYITYRGEIKNDKSQN